MKNIKWSPYISPISVYNNVTYFYGEYIFVHGLHLAFML